MEREDVSLLIDTIGEITEELKKINKKLSDIECSIDCLRRREF